MLVIPLYTSNVDWLLVCHDERFTVFLTKSEAREGCLFRIDLQKQAARAFQKGKKKNTQKGKDVSKVGIMKCSYVGVKNNEVLLLLLLFFLFTFWSIHVLVLFFFFLLQLRSSRFSAFFFSFLS